MRDKNLIPVVEIYEQALLNPSYLFDDSFSYHLNDHDRKNLKLIAGEMSNPKRLLVGPFCSLP